MDVQPTLAGKRGAAISVVAVVKYFINHFSPRLGWHQRQPRE
jgi:hypothetical protein